MSGGGGGGWRAPARLARREARRRPWRTLLMVALIGVPVGGAVGASVMLRTTTRTVEDERAVHLGRADDVVSVGGTDVDMTPEEQLPAVRDAYPPGSTFVAYHRGPDALEDGRGRLHLVDVSDRPWDEPLLDGTASLLHGRAPERSGEAALNRAALDAIHASVGDGTDLFLLGHVEIVGEFRDETSSGPQVVTADPPAPHPYRGIVAFVDLPAGRSGHPDAQALAAIGASSYAGADGEPFGYVRHEVRNRVTTAYVLVGVVLVVTAIVASAAFALGARRQLHTLGLLGATGAPPPAMRRVVLLQGTVTGAIASVFGAALGLAAAAATRPWLADRMDRTLPPLRVHPFDIVVPVALGILAATAAAWLPARSASRVPVLAALAGRRPTARVPVAVPLAGAAAIGAGATMLALWTRLDERPWGVGVAAALLVLVGGTAFAPWIVSYTEPLARRLRGGGRVAARDLARHRLRSGAVVAAVIAPAALSVFAAASALTNDARDRASGAAEGDDRLADSEVLVTYGGATDAEVARALSDVREALPGADELGVRIAVPRTAAGVGQEPGPPLSVRIADPSRPDPYGVTDRSRDVVVASADGLRTLDVPEPTIDALRAGKVVVFDLVGPDASVSLIRPGGATIPLERGDVAADPMTRVPGGDAIALVSEETAERWGAVPVDYATLFLAPSDLTDAQVRAVERATNADQQEQIRQYLTDPDATQSSLYAEIGRQYNVALPTEAGTYTWVAAAASLLFTLLVVAIALALDASESGDERALLAAIGAPPAVRRSIVAWQAFLLPALGALVAVPAGLLVSFAVLSDRGDISGPARGVAVQVPWGAIALLLVAVPLATAALTWLGVAVRGRRRHDLAALSLAAD